MAPTCLETLDVATGQHPAGIENVFGSTKDLRFEDLVMGLQKHHEISSSNCLPKIRLTSQLFSIDNENVDERIEEADFGTHLSQ